MSFGIAAPARRPTWRPTWRPAWCSAWCWAGLVIRGARPLPLSITAMAVLLALKLVTVVQMPQAPAMLSTARQAMMPTAQAAGSEAPHPGKAEPGKVEPGRAESGRAEAPAHPAPASTRPGAPATPGQAAPEPGGTAPGQAEPVSAAERAASDAERALLTDLRARRQVLDQRAAALDARDALAAAAEKRLQDRVDQLAALQTRLEALDQTRRERDEANWRSLVKTYETMRPKDAATIFNDLDQAVLLQVLDRMKESKAAPVLAAMQPERARLITAELAKWRNRAPAGQP